MNHRKILVLIIIVGCSLRVLYAAWVPDEFSHGTGFPDTYNYVSIAHNLAADFKYANSWQAPGGHPLWGDTGLTSFREPMFPLALALMFKLVGESPRRVFFMQAVLGTLTIPLSYAVAAMLFSPQAALLAALLESINPYHIYYATFISTENIATIVLLVVVWMALRALQSMESGGGIGRRGFIMLVISLTVSLLTRAVFVSIVAVTIFFLGLACYRHRAALAPPVRLTSWLVLLTAIGVAPWFIRNYRVWNRFVYHTNVGQVMVMGFNDKATGGDDDETRFLELDRAVAPLGYNEVERDRIYRHEALEWIRLHPGRAIYLAIKKQLLFWWPVPAVVTGYQKLIGLTWGLVFLPLALIGVVLSRLERIGQKYAIAAVLAFSLFHSIAIAVTRYRVPLEGILAGFAGCALAGILCALGFQPNALHMTRT